MTVRTFGKASAEAIRREEARLAALQELDMLDAPGDPGFDHLVELIKDVFTVQVGIVSLIDAHRQWYVSCDAFPWTEVPRDDSFCDFIVASETPLVVQDASRDPRFAKYPAVTGEEHIRFYAGVPLRTEAGHVVGTVCAIDRRPKSFSAKDVQILERIAQIAMDRFEALKFAATDGMTGLLNRRAFREEASLAITHALRQKLDLSCILLDIDNFKTVNDTHGHAAGDEVIKAVASACRDVCRATDRVGRLGGEELAIILPQADTKAAMVIAERLRQSIASSPVVGEFGAINVTASLGITSLSLFAKDIDTLLAQADIAMYCAKQGGRNRCVDWETKGGASEHSRRRVLKSGSIIFNNRRSTVDCTIKSLGSEGAGIMVSNAIGIPPDFTLLIPGDDFETACKVIAQNGQNIEVAFR